MTPLSFEWQWAPDYLIFMGLLYVALAVIGAGLLYTLIKTSIELRREDQGLTEDTADH